MYSVVDVPLTTMASQVYWPRDLLDTQCLKKHDAVIVWGVKCPNKVTIVINVVPVSFIPIPFKSNEMLRKEIEGHGIDIIGLIGDTKTKNINTNTQFDIIEGIITCKTATIVVFDPPLPQSMQFYSLSAIPISLVENKSLYDDNESQLARLLQDSLRDNSEKTHASRPDYSLILDKLNNCWNERLLLVKAYPDMPIIWNQHSSINDIVPSISEIISFRSLRHQNKIFTQIVWLMIYVILGIRHFFLIIIRVLNTKIYNLPSLVDISAVAQQVDLRLQQFAYFPIQYVKTTKFSLNEKMLINRSLPRDQYPEYIRFYNTLWLMANDITLGLSVSTFLVENQERISQFFNNVVVSRVLIQNLNDLSIWLMSSPGGIKLNNELARFLSDLFRWIIEFSRIVLINPFVPYYRHIVWVIAISSGTFGATLAISIFVDFLSVITFHLYCFYYSSAKIFNWLLSVMLSLFYLFWGKKRNVLRKRIDSNDYDLDQLLLGTLLFTVVTFLLPTVLAFYITFAIAELSIMMILGSLEIATVLLNHFPIFVLLLRIKDPKRIPGGIQISSDRHYTRIHSVPISFSEIFDHFNNFLAKLKRIYLTKKTTMDIVKGKPVRAERAKLHKLLYSALPSRPCSTIELYEEFKSFAS